MSNNENRTGKLFLRMSGDTSAERTRNFFGWAYRIIRNMKVKPWQIPMVYNFKVPRRNCPNPHCTAHNEENRKMTFFHTSERYIPCTYYCNACGTFWFIDGSPVCDRAKMAMSTSVNKVDKTFFFELERFFGTRINIPGTMSEHNDEMPF